MSIQHKTCRQQSGLDNNLIKHERRILIGGCIEVHDPMNTYTSQAGPQSTAAMPRWLRLVSIQPLKKIIKMEMT